MKTIFQLVAIGVLLLLINFALGGSWRGKIDDSVLPQKYLIDYVWVYEKQDASL